MSSHFDTFTYCVCVCVCKLESDELVEMWCVFIEPIEFIEPIKLQTDLGLFLINSMWNFRLITNSIQKIIYLAPNGAKGICSRVCVCVFSLH